MNKEKELYFKAAKKVCVADIFSCNFKDYTGRVTIITEVDL